MSDSTQPTAGQDNTQTPAQGGDQASAADTLFGDKQAQGGEKPDAKAEEQAKTDDQAAEGDKPDGEKEGDEAKGEAPEKYELKAPEGFEKLDDQLIEAFEPVARELGLSNEKAQQLVETMMPKVVERLAEQNRDAWGKQLETWVNDVKADKELGGDNLAGSLEAAKRAMERFGSPELKAMIDYPSEDNPKGLGLGNHPELVRVFARIGKAMADDKFVSSASPAGGGKRDRADILFGS